VIIEGSDIYGDGVNVAARLQEVAGPGEVVLSATAHEHAATRVDVHFTDAGEQSLKNIASPVRVFRWSAAGGGARTTSATGEEAREVPERPSIAVLPFDNMSGESEQEYLADGVVESITAALSRIRSFFVIARNSAFTYKGRHRNVREIGRELGVGYILEGAVQRAGGRVRITVQLIETVSGAHIWAEKYDGALDDIFELQDRITEQVAGALQPSIRLAEVERVRRKRPQDLGAYGYTMRAMPRVWALEKQEAERALALLDKALEIDPDYPLALALAAWCWAQRSVYSWVTNVNDAKTRALSLGERAATLSNDEPLILAVLGAVHTFARNFGTARVLLERAVALDPNAAWALSRLGWLEVYSGRPEAAHAYFERALRLSPLDPMNFNNHVGIASAFQVAGHPARAADEFLRALHERPNALWIHRNLAPALLAAGREEEAKASRDALTAAYPNFTIASFKEAMVFDPDALERIADDLRKLGVPEA
jgi:adenylate cyclase